MESYRFDFRNPCHVFFIGIGGVSMSGLAAILLKEGFRVSGSDMKESEFTRDLEEKGAKVYYGQKAENLADDVDCAVFTAAIHPDNPEFLACKERGIPMMTRAEFLGQLMREYGCSIAVSGTHGKTTTTGMLSHILTAAEKDPTISIGGVLPLIGGNIRIGGNQTFLLEACEYTNSFHIDDIRNSFHRFVGKLPENGTVIIDSSIRNYEEIVRGFPGQVITVGLENADITAEEIETDEWARPSFVPVVFGVRGERVSLKVPGIHNVGNALAAIAAAHVLGIPQETVRDSIAGFGGVDRRFEIKGELDGVMIVDDYAHHPQEIEATLKAALQCPHKTLWVTFQPHTYSRTKALMPEFAKALSLADRVVLAEIYPARETDNLGVHSSDVAALINASEPGKAVALPSFEKIETYLLEYLSPGDLCITMGAGDVYIIGENLLGKANA